VLIVSGPAAITLDEAREILDLCAGRGIVADIR
jgi:hypothetical protein